MVKKVERIKASLEIEEDIDLHITGWIVQRIGWAIMLAFLVLALTGFFGDGIVSNKRLVDGETSVIFEQYTRRESDTEIEIVASPIEGNIRLDLSPDFTATFKIEQIVPEPQRQGMANGKTVLDFPASGQGQITLFLNVRKHKIGKVSNTITVNNGDFTLHHYIYP